MREDIDLPPLASDLTAILDAGRQSHAISAERRAQMRLAIARKLATAAATATTLLVAEEARGQLAAAVETLRKASKEDDHAPSALQNGFETLKEAFGSDVSKTAVAGATKAALFSKVGATVTGLAFAGGVAVGTQAPVVEPREQPPAIVAPDVLHESRSTALRVQEPEPPLSPIDVGIAEPEELPTATAPATPRSAPRESTLMLEQALIERAQRALASRDYSAAISALQEHQQHFPRGELAEERMGFSALAHLRDGQREEGERIGHAYLERYPHGALARWIERELPSTASNEE